jgi:hypothetical protein
MLVAEEDDEVLGQRAMDLVLLPVRQSGLLRSMPPISAPRIGVSLSMVMVSYGARPSSAW